MRALCAEKKAIGPRKRFDCSTLQSIAEKNLRIVIRRAIAATACGNRASSRVWRAHLQEKLCDRYGLTVTVCHYPPGASKWNPIEHSMFNHISRNWEGEPLESFEKILKFIRTTTTDMGLKVRAVLNTKTYPTGAKISDEMMMSLSIRKGRALPQWNYTISPRRMSK